MNTLAIKETGTTEGSISNLLQQIRRRHDELSPARAPTNKSAADETLERGYFRHLRSWFRDQGVFPEIAEEIIDQVRHSSTKSIEEDIRCVEKFISRRWRRAPWINPGEGTHIFIGPAGSGKTTVL